MELKSRWKEKASLNSSGLVSTTQGMPSNLARKKSRAHVAVKSRSRSLAFFPRLIDVAISPEFN